MISSPLHYSINYSLNCIIYNYIEQLNGYMYVDTMKDSPS